MTSNVLDGVLVADFTMRGPGPFATAQLARLGARVVKFEPENGDPSRAFPSVFEAFNGGKESVVCDLSSPDGARLAHAVIAAADVFVCAWAPEHAAKLRLAWEDVREIRPGIVYCAISGFGGTAEWAGRPGHELTYLAASGALATLWGQHPPVIPGMPLGDVLAGSEAALRISASLAGYRRTGRAPGPIEVSVAGTLSEPAMIGMVAADTPLGPDWIGPARGIFASATGRPLALAIHTEPQYWRSLCDALGMSSARDLPVADILEQAAELRERVRTAIATLGDDSCERTLTAAGVPWAWVEPRPVPERFAGVLPSGEAPELGSATRRIREEFLPNGPATAPL